MFSLSTAFKALRRLSEWLIELVGWLRRWVGMSEAEWTVGWSSIHRRNGYLAETVSFRKHWTVLCTAWPICPLVDCFNTQASWHNGMFYSAYRLISSALQKSSSRFHRSLLQWTKEMSVVISVVSGFAIFFICLLASPVLLVHHVQKKGATLLSTITLASLGGFL